MLILFFTKHIKMTIYFAEVQAYLVKKNSKKNQLFLVYF
jgi:hypothetical protein